MTPKPIAYFTSDFADDFVIEGRDLIQMGGRNVAEEIRTIFGELGCQPSGLVDGGAKGWGISIHFEGEAFWCHVRSYFPSYILVFARPGRGSGGDRMEDRAYVELWGALDAALRADQRFHDLQWFYTLKEAPPPPPEWFGWKLGVRKRPSWAARYLARPLGWLSLVLSVIVFLDFVEPAPLTGLGYLALSGLLLSIGYKVSHVFGVRLPWVRLP